MSYWKDKTFNTIYRRIQKASQKHPERNINVLEQALREYYQTQDSVKLVSGKEYTPQQISAIKCPISKEDKQDEQTEQQLIYAGGKWLTPQQYQIYRENCKLAFAYKNVKKEQDGTIDYPKDSQIE